MTITINGTTGIAGVDGSASTPAVQGTDTNTGIFYPAADTIAFAEGGAEVARFDSSGRLGIGTSSPISKLSVLASGTAVTTVSSDAASNATIEGPNVAIASSFSSQLAILSNSSVAADTGGGIAFGGKYNGNAFAYYAAVKTGKDNATSGQFGGYLSFASRANGGDITERARITSGGVFLVGKTSASAYTTAGFDIDPAGLMVITRNNGQLLVCNRQNDDGTLVTFRQDNIDEGTISVSGTTVSYNGGHLSRWAQMPGTKDDTLVKGTVMSNLDEMNVYTKDGEPVDNEQLNKVKVSDVEGDVNVAGVFVNWTYDDAHQVDEINMAMTGDMIIRIAQGVVVQKGDLLMSAGDGTAKPQGDDIVRSKTVAKVTSNHVTCTYADGSYCVPCVLMAC